MFNLLPPGYPLLLQLQNEMEDAKGKVTTERKIDCLNKLKRAVEYISKLSQQSVNNKKNNLKIVIRETISYRICIEL